MYKAERNKTRNLSRLEHRRFLRTLNSFSQKAQTPSPNLHNFIRSLRSDSTGKPTVSRFTVRGAEIKSPDIANALNEQFIAFGTPDNPQWTLRPLQDASTAPPLTSIFTTPYAVHKCIKRLKLRKAAGPDGVTHELLKLIGPSISLPLSLLFKSVFLHRYFSNCLESCCRHPAVQKQRRKNGSDELSSHIPSLNDIKAV